MTEGLEIINKAVNDYITGANITDYEDLLLINNLNNIILNGDDVYFKYKYDKKYSLKESEKIAKDFLLQLNPYYAEYYNIRKEDGTFVFDHDPQTFEPAYSSYDLINNKRIMYIPLEKNVEDIFTIIHELMHDINMDINFDSSTRYIYTETLSLLSEFILEDYLKDKNVKQYKNPNNRGLY